MSRNSGITEEDFELFNNSGINLEAKENTFKNINKGNEYENALDTPHGRLLMKDLQDILVGELAKITAHKTDSTKSPAENYDIIMLAINKYQTAASMKVRWEGILKTKDASLKRVKKVSKEIRNKSIR